jgi:hypothetical protein
VLAALGKRHLLAIDLSNRDAVQLLALLDAHHPAARLLAQQRDLGAARRSSPR